MIQNENDYYLKTFFEIELSWVADRAYQLRTWTGPDAEDKFVTAVYLLFVETWVTINDNRKEFKLSDYQFDMINKIYEMVRAFVFIDKSPDFSSVVYNPEWIKIQSYAKEVYDKLYPLVK